MHEYYIKRKDKIHEKYVNDKKDKMKDYYKQNKESLLKKVKEYQYKNRDDIKNYRNEYLAVLPDAKQNSKQPMITPTEQVSVLL